MCYLCTTLKRQQLNISEHAQSESVTDITRSVFKLLKGFRPQIALFDLATAFRCSEDTPTMIGSMEGSLPDSALSQRAIPGSDFSSAGGK
eukprot:COSAG02_NODE_2921_length_7747_cov_9.003400_5_plen_90_part_00